MARRTFLWCDRCRRSFDYPDAPGGLCPICGSEMRELGWMSAFVRGFLAQELSSSGIASRHRQIIRQIWTANGMGERYYKVLAPPVRHRLGEHGVAVHQRDLQPCIRLGRIPGPAQDAVGGARLDETEDRGALEFGYGTHATIRRGTETVSSTILWATPFSSRNRRISRQRW